MTPRELADLLMRARAAGVLGTYFDHEPAPLAALLTFYGAECAAQERERCAQLCDNITTLRAEQMGLSHYDHLTGAVCARALRALT